jgi:hypothetical protein
LTISSEIHTIVDLIQNLPKQYPMPIRLAPNYGRAHGTVANYTTKIRYVNFVFVSGAVVVQLVVADSARNVRGIYSKVTHRHRPMQFCAEYRDTRDASEAGDVAPVAINVFKYPAKMIADPHHLLHVEAFIIVASIHSQDDDALMPSAPFWSGILFVVDDKLLHRERDA